MAQPTACADLKNMNATLVELLARLGLRTDADIRKHGVAEVYATLKVRFGSEVALDALAAIQGALMGVDVAEVPALLLDDLKRESWEIIRDYKASQR